MPHRPRPGVSRRELLQVGFSGLLGVSTAGRASAAPKKPKSVILVFLTGAASQLDTFDPKPDAPAEVRGEFVAIPTAVPGVRFGEHLPKLAARLDRATVVRTLAHKDNNHTAATHHVVTGALQSGAYSISLCRATTGRASGPASGSCGRRSRGCRPGSRCRRSSGPDRSSGRGGAPGSSGRSSIRCR